MNLCNIPQRLRAKPVTPNPNRLIRIRQEFDYTQPMTITLEH